MNIFSIIVFSITGCIISVFIKKYNPEISILISILASVMILSYIIINSTSVFERLNYMFSLAGVNDDNIQLLIKSLGICFVTQLTSDICEESGQKAIANKVELSGKFFILYLALPIFTQLFNIITSIINR